VILLCRPRSVGASDGAIMTGGKVAFMRRMMRLLVRSSVAYFRQEMECDAADLCLC
jgi:hypothetical protein